MQIYFQNTFATVRRVEFAVCTLLRGLLPPFFLSIAVVSSKAASCERRSGARIAVGERKLFRGEKWEGFVTLGEAFFAAYHFQLLSDVRRVRDFSELSKVLKRLENVSLRFRSQNCTASKLSRTDSLCCQR